MKQLIRQVAGSLFGLVQGAALKGTLSVFVYHDVSDSPGEFSRRYHLNVLPEVFARQMDLVKKDFDVIGPDELLKGDLPQRAAMVTFDDGFKGAVQAAASILQAKNIPAMVFLNMAAVHGGVLWAALVTFLCGREDFCAYCSAQGVIESKGAPLFLKCSRALVEDFLNCHGRDAIIQKALEYQGPFAVKDDLRRLDGKGMFFGNHLFDHEVPLLMPDEDFIAAYRRNVEALKIYRNYREMLSFPFGQPGTCFDRHHIDLAMKLGARKVFFSSGGLNVDRQGVLLNRFELKLQDNSLWMFRGSLCRAYMIGRRDGCRSLF